MTFDYFWKRFVSFGLTFALGLFIAAFLSKADFENLFKKEVKSPPKIASSENNGTGSAACGGSNFVRKDKETAKTPLSELEGLKIISKPRAFYTEEAKANLIQGKVVLRVTFKADGEIGGISVISGLPDGLTEVAIEAAKKIKFEPAKRDGERISVTKPLEYSFWIY